MVKITKSERKYGKKTDDQSSVTKKPKGRSREIQTKPEEDMYKVLIEGSAFTKAMTYTECEKVIARYEEKAKKLRHRQPSLILVKQ